jgi:hypothetical protein
VRPPVVSIVEPLVIAILVVIPSPMTPMLASVVVVVPPLAVIAIVAPFPRRIGHRQRARQQR